MEEYITSVQLAEQMGITKRQVNALCAAGKIEGAHKSGNRWLIPADAADGRAENAGKIRGKLPPFPIGI